MTAAQPRTLLDKLWEAHEITRREDGASLLWVDRHLVHEGSHHAFAKLDSLGLKVAEPGLTFAIVDHYAPTRDRNTLEDPRIRHMITTLERNADRHGLRIFPLLDPRQGIVHVVGPEQGLVLPGFLVNCGDSHTSTNGAFGTLAFGIGATEVAHVLATQTIWQVKPKSMRVTITGRLGPGVSAKDIALNWIAGYGADHARGHAVEFSGDTVAGLSMDGRMTLCNMSIEGGARMGMIAPDACTLAYLRGRAHAPGDEFWDRAAAEWSELHSDPDAAFDTEISINAQAIAPTVTWGTSPEQAVPVDASVPSPDGLDPARAEQVRSALDYMGLEPGSKIAGTPVDQVFIGSCTNARIEDLRAAAEVLKGRKARVPGRVSPGSMLVRVQAEQEGLADIFTQAGLSWEAAGCSMCVAMNGDTVAPGVRCASTTNRNFRGRQGPGARTHLMSPAMVAAAAVTGVISDPRPFLETPSAQGRPF